MLLVINKIVGTNRWGYPETPQLFKKAFSSPTNDGTLIADYQGERSAAELGLTEYTGEIPPSPDAIRVITTGAFRSRFSPAVRKLTRDSVVDEVIDLRVDLAGRSYVDLDDPDTVNGVYAFGPDVLGWMTAEEVVAQLASGTTKEKYNGVR